MLSLLYKVVTSEIGGLLARATSDGIMPALASEPFYFIRNLTRTFWSLFSKEKEATDTFNTENKTPNESKSYDGLVNKITKDFYVVSVSSMILDVGSAYLKDNQITPSSELFGGLRSELMSYLNRCAQGDNISPPFFQVSDFIKGAFRTYCINQTVQYLQSEEDLINGTTPLPTLMVAGVVGETALHVACKAATNGQYLMRQRFRKAHQS